VILAKAHTGRAASVEHFSILGGHGRLAAQLQVLKVARPWAQQRRRSARALVFSVFFGC
jgi:hypothetical protein